MRDSATGSHELYLDITRQKADLAGRFWSSLVGVFGLSLVLLVSVTVVVFRAAADIAERDRVKAALEESETRLTMAQRIARVGDWDWDVAKGTETWSEQMFRLVGLEHTDEHVPHGQFEQSIHQSDWERVRDALEKAAFWKEPFDLEARIDHADGSIRFLDFRAKVVGDGNSAPLHVVGTAQDITERKVAEIELKLSEERYRKLVETTSVVAWEMDFNSQQFLYVSAHAGGLLGFESDEWLAPDFWAARLHPDDRQEVLDSRITAVMDGEDYEHEYRLSDKDGATVWVRDIVTVPPVGLGKHPLRGFMIDITQRRVLEEKIKHMASHDALTGLPNRALFRDRLETALVRAERQETFVAALFIDLDGFKLVNDTMGHEAGDILLMRVSERLMSVVRRSDTVGRHGGDEFTVVLADMKDLDAVSRVAEEILQAVGEPIPIDGTEAKVGASIGIAVYLRHGETADELLKQADAAMYAAKAQGKNRFVFSSPKESK